MIPYAAAAFRGRGSPIKSITNYTITLTSGSTSTTQSLSPAVDKTHAYAYLNGWRSLDTSFLHIDCMPRIELTDNNTVTVSINTANGSADIVVEVQVVHWAKWAVHQVYHNTISLPAATSSVADTFLNSITFDSTRAAIIYLGATSSHSSQAISSSRALVNMTSSQTAAVRRATTGDVVVGYAVIMFKAACVRRVLRQTSFTATSGTGNTKSIAAVDTNASVVAFGGFNSSSGFQNGMPRLVLTDATTLTMTRGASNSDTLEVGSNVIEFQPNLIRQKISGETTVATTTSETNVTIPAATLAKTLLHMSGFSTDNATGNMNTSYLTIKTTSTTNVKVQRASTSASVTSIAAWSGVEFY